MFARFRPSKIISASDAATYAYCASFALIVVGGWAYLRWIEPATSFGPYSGDGVSRAKKTFALLPIVPSILLAGAWASPGSASDGVRVGRLYFYTIFALVPVVLVFIAASNVKDNNYRSVATELFNEQVSQLEDVEIDEPSDIYGAGSQLFLCANEYETKNPTYFKGQYCLEIDTTAPDSGSAISGGYRIDDGGLNHDCFGSQRYC